jgi:hypothetical protein
MASSPDAHRGTKSPEYSRAFRRLCHVAALTREQRPRQAVEQLILTTLTVDSEALLDPTSLVTAIEAYFGLTLARNEVAEATARLTAAGSLVPSPLGRLVVSAASRAEVEERATSASDLERRVRDAWAGDLRRALGLELPEAALWSGIQAFLATTFRDHGVETVQLLAPPGGELADLSTLEGHIREATAKADARNPPAKAAARRTCRASARGSPTRMRGRRRSCWTSSSRRAARSTWRFRTCERAWASGIDRAHPGGCRATLSHRPRARCLMGIGSRE